MNEETYYSNPEDVIKVTGIKYSDFPHLESEEELEEMITDWLVEIKSFIDYDRNRNYHTEEKIPKGIHQIARRACSNMVAYALQRQKSPIVRIGDWNVRMVEENVFSSSLLRDLSRFPAKPRFRMFVVKKEEENND